MVGLRQLHFKFHLEKGCGVSPVKLINRNWFFPRSLLWTELWALAPTLWNGPIMAIGSPAYPVLLMWTRAPTSLKVWERGKGSYLFQLLVGREPEVTELLLWFYEGFFILPLDKSPLSDQDWARAWRCGAGKHIQSILGCLPWGRRYTGTRRALAAKPRQWFGLGGLVRCSPLKPNRNLLWGHAHEHDGPILTFLTVFHSLPIRECEGSFLRCYR